MDPADIDLEMQRVLDTHLDEHTRLITALWVQAWSDARTELEAALAADKPTERIQAALEKIEARLARAASDAAVVIDDSTAPVTRLGVEGEVMMIGAQAPVTVARADEDQIDAIIQRASGSILASTEGITPAVMDVIRRRLTGGVTLGENPRQVARRILKDTEGDFNGGLPRALNIARTEMLDAMRTAQWATDQANKAVLRGWMWQAHLDARTCRSCVGMHGTEHPVEEEGPVDHHSGRCARLPLTKSWADLGFTGVPDTVIPVEDASSWFDGLPEKDQRSMLTDRGFEAWRRGDYPMGQWATTKTNDGWRDSVVPSTPPGGRVSESCRCGHHH